MKRIVFIGGILYCCLCIRIAGNIFAKTNFRLIEVSFWGNFTELVTESRQLVASVVNTVLVNDLSNRCLYSTSAAKLINETRTNYLKLVTWSLKQ